MFKIGINGADLEGRGTGVQRYLRSVIPFLDTTGKEYIVYSRSPLPHDSMPQRKGISYRDTGHRSGYSYTIWEQRVLPGYLKNDSIDIFFSAGYSLPLKIKIPTLVVIHDISFAVHPEWFGRREGLRRRFISRKSAQSADYILTVSEFSKNEIIKHYEINPDKIIITPNGVDFKAFATVSPSEINLVKQKYNLSAPLILYTGLLMERRFIRELVEAFVLLKKQMRTMQLVLIGRNQLKDKDFLKKIIKGNGLEQSILHLEYCDNNELKAFYHQADLFVYLSEYEGFGIPPLEAMACSTPVLTSNLTALAENFHQSALLVDDHSPESIAKAMDKLLSDEKLRTKLVKAGKDKAKEFSWENTAGIINSAIKKIIEKKLSV
ncbi:MAG: glycosyltransferase family 4 protein [Acidobacteria bacterium]|nr:glycosyltransferase family 4 protein [Acidobacteriota bacterium]